MGLKIIGQWKIKGITPFSYEQKSHFLIFNTFVVRRKITMTSLSDPYPESTAWASMHFFLLIFFQIK